MRRTFLPIVVAAMATLTAALALAARGPNPDSNPTAEEVAARTMSPFCPGLTVAECPSAQSAELRDRIASKVDAGETNREIDEWLLASYGETVMARPRGLLAYLVPVSVVVSGGFLVTFLVLRWARGRDSRWDTRVQPSTSIEAEDRERITAELSTFAKGTE